MYSVVEKHVYFMDCLHRDLLFQEKNNKLKNMFAYALKYRSVDLNLLFSLNYYNII